MTSRYRSKLTGDLVEAAQFKGGHIDDAGLCFGGGIENGDWVVDAFNRRRMEVNAFGTALILYFRGGSYGIARGDWVLRNEANDLIPCVGDRFKIDYEAIT